MFTWIANAICSLWQGQSRNVGQGDEASGHPRNAKREESALGLSPYRELSDAEDPDQVTSVILVPDITQSSRETWTTDGGQFWPNESLKDFHIFGFDYYKPFAESTESTETIEKLLSYDAIRMNALRLLSEMQRMKNQRGAAFSPVLIAHGYGGLICEQAYLFSLQAPQWNGLIQLTSIILFGTPHSLAGLAQWALISAKKLGKRCANSPQQEDWSKPTIDKDLKRIAEMQKVFRDLDSENLKPRHSQPRMACYYSMLPIPENKLEISPQWAILPGVRAIALDAHHFGMTKVNEPRSRDIIELPLRVSQETLKQSWTESSQEYHGEEQTQASVTTPILRPDKIFTSSVKSANKRQPIPRPRSRWRSMGRLRADNDTASPEDRRLFGQTHGERIWEICDGIVQNLHREGMINDIRGLELYLNQAPALDAILDFAVQNKQGLKTLQVLFVLRGDQITITKKHLESAAKNTESGTDILELILLLRGDEVSKANVGDIAKAAAARKPNGLTAMHILLDRYFDEILPTGIYDILKSAVANEGDGVAAIKALLDRFGDQDRLPEPSDIFKGTVGNRANGPVILEILLDKYGDQVPHDMDDIFQRAAANTGSGAALMLLLVDRYGDRIDFLTEGVAKAATRNESVMRLEVSRILFRAAMNKNRTTFARLLGEPRRSHDSLDDRFSWKMLSWAAAQGDDETFKLLLESCQVQDDVKDYNDELIKRKDKGDWTLLTYAVFKKDLKVIKALHRTDHINKDDLEAQRKGQPALVYAAALGLNEIVKQLLEVDGIQVNQKDAGGWTSLFHAVEAKEVEVVKTLLEHGADINARDENGNSPFLMAEENEDILQLFSQQSKVS